MTSCCVELLRSPNLWLNGAQPTGGQDPLSGRRVLKTSTPLRGCGLGGEKGSSLAPLTQAASSLFFTR